MERDGFKCQYCLTESEKLNVHHRYYVSKRDPWFYPNWSFATICDNCHAGYHNHAESNFYGFEQLLESLSGGNYSDDFIKHVGTIINSDSVETKIQSFKSILESQK